MVVDKFCTSHIHPIIDSNIGSTITLYLANICSPCPSFLVRDTATFLPNQFLKTAVKI